MRTINHERVVELKIILNASERWVYVLEQDFESYIILHTDLAQCNMIDITILHVLCIEKENCVLRHQFLRWVIDMDSSDPNCKINSIKTDNNYGFLINIDIVLNWYVETVHVLLEVISTYLLCSLWLISLFSSF